MPDDSAQRLLGWFRSSARELPWRTPLPRDPYAVLVSEVMAQQTQLERVVPAFRRFLKRFPSVRALAAAKVEDVLHAFSGLGYYRRARLLHEAARAIATRDGWPTTVRGLAALPGFGPYTAAAVAAFAFGGDEPPVDGNIARVTARVRGLPLSLGSGPLVKQGVLLARELHAEVGTPEVWEALMELGATVCTPSRPGCGSCPLAGRCVAHRDGRPTAFPLPRVRREREGQLWVALWLERSDGRVLLREVEEGRLLAGLWLPPISVLTDGVEPEDAARALAVAARFKAALVPTGTVRHSITHREIRVLSFVGLVRGGRVSEPRNGWSWQDPQHLTVPSSSLVSKLAQACARPTLPLSFPTETEE